MNYRGIIIKESLSNPSILDNLEILSEKTWEISHNNVWHLYKVAIPENKIHEFTEALKENIKPDGTWYTHFYHENPDKKENIIVVFHNKKFLTGESDLERVVKYGLSIGIPKKQLDFKPRSVAEEAW